MSEKFRARQYSYAHGLGKRQADMAYRLAKLRTRLAKNGYQLGFVAEIGLHNLMNSVNRSSHKEFKRAVKIFMKVGEKK